MIISKKFYDKCCPSYQKIIDEYEKIIADLKKRGNPFRDKQVASHIISLILYKLAGSCLVPKDYWGYCYSLMRSKCERDEERRQALKSFSNAHFYFIKDFFGTNDEFYGLLLEYQYDISKSEFPICEYYFNYPHNYLKQCFRKFERNSMCHPSEKLIKKYEAMEKLYLKIKAAEQDSEKWFKILTELDNCRFVCENVENRLGENLHDVELWKLYIEFLREKDPKRMLLIYSKYCRFFIDDLEMKEKYKEEMAKYGPLPSIDKYGPRPKKYEYTWTNWFDFESIDDDVIEEENKILKVKKEEVESFDKSVCKKFFEHVEAQNFSFRDSFITYILDNASHRVLRKLFQTCKYFFSRKQILISFRFEGWDNSHDEDGLRLEDRNSITWEEIFKLPKIYITACIDVVIEFEDIYVKSKDTDDESKDTDNDTTDDEDDDTDTNNTDDEDETVAVKNEEVVIKREGRSFISSLIPRIYRCDAKYIRLRNQNISFNELQFLIDHGNVFELKLKSCELKDNDGNYIDLEKIMEFIPHIENLHLSDVNFNPNTANTLTSQKFYGKISKFVISGLDGVPFDVDEFLKFLITNRDKKFKLRLFFNRTFDRDFVKNFKNAITYQTDGLSGENTEIDIY